MVLFHFFFLLTCLTGPFLVYGQNRFSPPIDESLLIPLEVDPRPPDFHPSVVEVGLQYYPKEVYFRKNKFFSILRELINDDLYQDFIRAGLDKEWVSLSLLRKNGLNLIYDDSSVQVRLVLPPLQKKIMQTSFKSSPPKNFQRNSIDPDPWSGFINFYFSKTIIGEGKERPISVLMPTAFYGHGHVLEADWQYENHRFLRQDVRLIKDDQKRLLRFTAGDLHYQTQGFQSFRPLGGVMVHRHFELDPTLDLTPASQQEIFLERPSMVVVKNNDFILRTFFLEAGRHQLQDFPLYEGMNDLTIEITDKFGRKESHHYSLFRSNEILRTGIHHFSYGAGYPYREENGVRHYRARGESPSGSFFHRYGLFKTGTLEGNWQGDSLQQLLGSGILWNAERLGMIHLQGGLSKIQHGPSGQALKMSYSFQDYRGPHHSSRKFDLTGDVVSHRFASLGQLSPQSSYRYSLTPSLSHLLWENTFAQLSYHYKRGRQTPEKKAYQTTFSLQRTLMLNLSLRVSVFKRKDLYGNENVGGFLFLTWALPESRQFMNGQYDFTQESQILSWQRDFTNREGGMDMTGQVHNSQLDRQLRVGSQYQHYRGILAVDTEVTENKTQVSPGEKSQRKSKVQLKLASALAFVGTHVSLTRPITGSFALIDRSHNLKSQTVKINSLNGEAQGQADFFGPGVIPHLTPFRPYEIHMDLENPHEHLWDFENQTISLMPTYKSGHLIMAELKKTLWIKGFLKDQEGGKPLSMIVGTLNKREGREQVGQVFFTNAQGEFVLYKVGPGEYSITFQNDQYHSVIIKIPASEGAEVDLGFISVRKTSLTEPLERKKKNGKN